MLNQAFEYDENNRLTSISNPARSFGYDNAGNTISDSPNYTVTYGPSGSIASITKAGITGYYSYDASRRRIRKFMSAGAGSTVIFVYDLEDQLLGEYDQSGAAIREYVWLDNIPVAMFTPDPANLNNPPLVFYIHADGKPGRWGMGRVALVLCSLALLTLFSLGQAITFAWLSTSPAPASRLESLQWRFWSYAVLSLVLLAIDLWLAWVLVMKAFHRRKSGPRKP